MRPQKPPLARPEKQPARPGRRKSRWALPRRPAMPAKRPSHRRLPHRDEIPRRTRKRTPARRTAKSARAPTRKGTATEEAQRTQKGRKSQEEGDEARKRIGNVVDARDKRLVERWRRLQIQKQTERQPEDVTRNSQILLALENRYFPSDALVVPISLFRRKFVWGKLPFLPVRFNEQNYRLFAVLYARFGKNCRWFRSKYPRVYGIVDSEGYGDVFQVFGERNGAELLARRVGDSRQYEESFADLRQDVFGHFEHYVYGDSADGDLNVALFVFRMIFFDAEVPNVIIININNKFKIFI